MIILAKSTINELPLLENGRYFNIGKYRCKAVNLSSDSSSWYLHIDGFSNDKIFDDLGIDKNLFCVRNNLKILKRDGIFPYLSQTDLTRAVYILKKELYEKQSLKDRQQKETEAWFPF